MVTLKSLVNWLSEHKENDMYIYATFKIIQIQGNIIRTKTLFGEKTRENFHPAPNFHGNQVCQLRKSAQVSIE